MDFVQPNANKKPVHISMDGLVIFKQVLIQQNFVLIKLFYK